MIHYDYGMEALREYLFTFDRRHVLSVMIGRYPHINNMSVIVDDAIRDLKEYPLSIGLRNERWKNNMR